MANETSAEVYRLHVWIRQITPMIWRRLLVRSDSTITDLHHILQIVFGWSDAHLNGFHIHGQDYGVYHDGGVSFSTNPNQVRLCDFKFRINERFSYETAFAGLLRGGLRHRPAPRSCRGRWAGDKRAAMLLPWDVPGGQRQDRPCSMGGSGCDREKGKGR